MSKSLRLTQGHALPLSSWVFCNPIDEYLPSAWMGAYNCGDGFVVTIANETVGHAVSYWHRPRTGACAQFCLYLIPVDVCVKRPFFLLVCFFVTY